MDPNPTKELHQSSTCRTWLEAQWLSDASPYKPVPTEAKVSSGTPVPREDKMSPGTPVPREDTPLLGYVVRYLVLVGLLYDVAVSCRGGYGTVGSGSHHLTQALGAHVASAEQAGCSRGHIAIGHNSPIGCNVDKRPHQIKNRIVTCEHEDAERPSGYVSVYSSPVALSRT